MCDIQHQTSSLPSFMDTDYGSPIIIRSGNSVITPKNQNCFTIVASPKLLKAASLSNHASPVHYGTYNRASLSSLTSLQQNPETPSSEASRPTRQFIGSINIESPLPDKSSPLAKTSGSLERFSDDFYSRIAVFMDQEGLEIIEAESCLRGFKQIIKLQVVENSEGDHELTSMGQLKCIRIDSGNSDISMDVKSSKLFQRRSSVTTPTPTPKLALPTTSSDDNFMSSKSINHIRNLHEIVGFQAKEKTTTGFKNKLKTLLSVDSWEQSDMGGKTPLELSDCSPATSIFELAENIEKMSPGLGFGSRCYQILTPQATSPVARMSKDRLVSATLPRRFKRGDSVKSVF